MRETRRKAIALLAVLQLIAAVGAGAEPGGRAAHSRRSPSGLVNDFASLVDPAPRADRWRICSPGSASATGAEVAVVTLPTIDDQDEARGGARDRAEMGRRRPCRGRRRAAQRGPGAAPRAAAVNHEPGTGHVRIEVGQGLEGIVTDAASGQIRREVMGPLLAQEEYGPALRAGVRALTGLIARGFGVTDSTLALAPPPASRPGRPARSSSRSCRCCSSSCSSCWPIGADAGAGYIGVAAPGLVAAGGGGGGGGGSAVEVAGSVASAVVAASAAVAPEDGSDARDGRSRGDAVPRGRGRGARRRLQRAALRLGRPRRLSRRAARTSTSCWCSTTPRPTRLRALAPAFATWRKAASEPPLLISRAEWARATRRVPDRDHRHARRLPGASRGRSAGRCARSAAPICGRRWSASCAASCSGCARATRRQPATRSCWAKLAAGSAGTILVLLRSLLTPGGPGGARRARGARRRGRGAGRGTGRGR